MHLADCWGRAELLWRHSTDCCGGRQSCYGATALIVWGGQSCYGATALIVGGRAELLWRHSIDCWGRAELLWRHCIDCCFVSGHSDITKFRPWSAFATGNHLDCVENIPMLLSRLAMLRFLIHVQSFLDQFSGELQHVQNCMDDGPNPTHSREMPICSAIQLAQIRRSSKISL